MAGGLNWEQQQFIMERMQPNEYREVFYGHSPYTNTITNIYLQKSLHIISTFSLGEKSLIICSLVVSS